MSERRDIGAPPLHFFDGSRHAQSTQRPSAALKTPWMLSDPRENDKFRKYVKHDISKMSQGPRMLTCFYKII